jgi:hypothetical protein
LSENDRHRGRFWALENPAKGGRNHAAPGTDYVVGDASDSASVTL